MRPGQNKQRMRGRNNNNNNNGRKGPNPLTRSFESNGPDVKIRGTAQHIGEKYLQLARDAQTSGDPVAAENYLQHAEHYFRLIAAAQLAQQQAVQGYQRPEGEVEEADDEDDLGGLPDRFASPFERQVQPPQAQPPQNNGQNFNDQPRQDMPRPDQQRQDQPRGDYQRTEGRQDNARQDGYRQDGNRQDGNRQDSNRQDGNRQDSNRQDQPRQDFRPNGERQERSYNDRNFNGQNNGGERQDRNNQDRNNQPRNNRWPRDNRGPRPNEPRDNRVQGEFAPREANDTRNAAPEIPIQESVGLPAFITTPVRVPISVESQPLVNTPVAVAAPQAVEGEVTKPRRGRPKRPVFIAESAVVPGEE